jgi:hypothetical protein
MRSIRDPIVNKFREMLVNASRPGNRPEKGRESGLLCTERGGSGFGFPVWTDRATIQI